MKYYYFKVLILVPFKNAAYKVVKTLMEILVPKEAGQVVNKNRFEEEFTGGELLMPQKNPKPEDYELMFSGNTEDTFRLAMTLTKKTLKVKIVKVTHLILLVLEWSPWTRRCSVGWPTTRWRENPRKVAGTRWMRMVQVWQTLGEAYVRCPSLNVWGKYDDLMLYE